MEINKNIHSTRAYTFITKVFLILCVLNGKKLLIVLGRSTRVCILRTGVVLGLGGGALGKMILPYKLGLGGPIGKGNQFIPWIHLLDMVRGIIYLIETEHAHGEFNLCAPHPVTNKQFSQTLAKSLKRPHLLFTPKWVLNIVMGESAILLFDSLRAKPKKTHRTGLSL